MSNKEAILKAAINQFSSMGFAATRTQEIANEAKVSQPLLYAHYKNKGKLFTHCVKYLLDAGLEHEDKLNAIIIMEVLAMSNRLQIIAEERKELTRLIACVKGRLRIYFSINK